MATEIENIIDKWGLQLVEDTKAAIESQVKNSGGQESDLGGSVKFFRYSDNTWVLTMKDYWRFFDKGRKPGKMPPTKAIRSFIEKKGFSQAKANEILKLKGRTKVKWSKKLDRLSWAFAKSIAKKGTEAHPFYDKVINQKRIDDLKSMLAPALKKEFIMNIKFE